MDNCPICGVDRDVWGKLHNCKPRKPTPALPAQPRISSESETYRYRNKEKRQAQVAAAMRAYRVRLKEKRDGGHKENRNV
jgi:hypothetical protein